jgi:hypothetical protein
MLTGQLFQARFFGFAQDKLEGTPQTRMILSEFVSGAFYYYDGAVVFCGRVFGEGDDALAQGVDDGVGGEMAVFNNDIDYPFACKFFILGVSCFKNPIGDDGENIPAGHGDCVNFTGKIGAVDS